MSLVRARPLVLPLLVAALIGGTAHAATKPVVQGSLSRWPAPARNVLGAVTAIDADSGAVVATVAAPKGRYRLALPSGTYILVARGSDLKHDRTRFLTSNVVALGRRGQTVDLPGNPPLRKRARARARTAAASGGGGSIGIGTIPVSADPGSGLKGGNAIDPIVQGLLPECQRNGEKLLDTSKQTEDARAREQQLSDDGRTQTPITATPANPDRSVTGRVDVDADGKPVVDITITDTKTGEVIDHIRIAGDKNSDAEDIARLLRRLGQGIGQRDCKEPEPPAPRPAPTPAPAPAPAPPAPAPPAPTPTGLITVTYSGSEDVTSTLYNGTVVQRAHFDWSMTRSRTRDGWVTGATSWPFSSLNGSISSSRPQRSCSATLSPPATPDPSQYNLVNVQPPNGSRPAAWHVQAGGVPSWNTFPTSSDTTPGSDCQANTMYFFAPPESSSQQGDAFDEQWYAAWAPEVDIPDTSSATVPVNFQHTWTTCSDGSAGCTLDVNLQSTITLSKG